MQKKDAVGHSEAVSKPEWVDPDDAPELTDEYFEDAEYWQGDTFIRRGRGRPKSDNPKETVTIQLDPDVLAKLREAGPGWQSRVNDILRKAVLDPA